MKRLILQFVDNRNFQDAAGIVRGVYKVVDGLHQNHQKSTESIIFNDNQVYKDQIQQQLNEQSQYQEMDSHLTEQEKQENEFKYQQQQQQLKNKQQEEQILQNKLYEQQKKAAQEQMEILQEQQRQQQLFKKQQEQEQLNIKIQQEQELNIQKQQQQTQQTKIEIEESEPKVKDPLEGLQFKQNNQQNENSSTQNQQNSNSQQQNTDLELDFDDVFGTTNNTVGKEVKVPESSLSRAFNFGMLGVNVASGAISSYVKSSFTGKKEKSYIFNEGNAESISKTLCKMRGAPLKLGQALSIQDDNLIPKEVRQAFEKARKSADVMPKTQLYMMLEQELGKDWKQNFLKFDETPVAAASIGQVHRAQLKDGRFVAVKVQYPGVKESIDSDLNNLKRLLKWTGMAPKTMFIDQLVANTRAELFQECDYRVELQKQEQFREFLGQDSRYNIPNVHKNLSTERIFTTDYIVGDSLDKIADTYPQDVRNEVGKRIMDLTLKELFVWYYMQSDPNPSNFFYNAKQDKLHLIDFGACHFYRKEFMHDYTEVVYAAIVQNKQEIIRKSIDLGFLNGKESDLMLDAHCQTIQTVAEPFALDEVYDFGAQQLTKKAYDTIPIMLKHRLKAPPPEVYSLHRKFSGAYLLNMRLGSKYNCRDLFMPLYRQYEEKKKNNQL